MHTEVFNNIDTLIDMAGSTLNIDEINTDLLTLRKEIKNKKADMEELNSLISDARYFNASNELVDKNIQRILTSVSGVVTVNVSGTDLEPPVYLQ